VLLVITFAVVGLANRVPGLRQGSVRSVHY
jgi:hypothetical protein